jgi:hypothetical protein
LLQRKGDEDIVRVRRLHCDVEDFLHVVVLEAHLDARVVKASAKKVGPKKRAKKSGAVDWMAAFAETDKVGERAYRTLLARPRLTHSARFYAGSIWACMVIVMCRSDALLGPSFCVYGRARNYTTGWRF